MRRAGLNPTAGGLLILVLLACGSRSGDEHGCEGWWGDRRQTLTDEDAVSSALPPALHGLDCLEAGARKWAYGIPDHPALDLDPPADIPGKRPKGLWTHLPRLLFSPDPEGQWRRRGFYRPWQDGHGPLQRLRALEDGTFVATSGLWFRDGGRVSPCARYALDGNSELRFQELLNPQPGTTLPATVPAADDATAPWGPWAPRRGFIFTLAGDHVLALVNLGADCLTPLDPRNGHPMACVPFPRSSSGTHLTVLTLQPGSGGALSLEGYWPTNAGPRDRSPESQLATARLNLPPIPGRALPAAFRLEPGSVTWRTQPLSPERAALLGSPDTVQSRMTRDGRIQCSPRVR